MDPVLAVPAPSWHLSAIVADMDAVELGYWRRGDSDGISPFPPIESWRVDVDWQTS
jgi:hypothetical protein